MAKSAVLNNFDNYHTLCLLSMLFNVVLINMTVLIVQYSLSVAFQGL